MSKLKNFKNIIFFLHNYFFELPLPLKTCGEICLLATTLKNAKIVNNFAFLCMLLMSPCRSFLFLY